MTTRTAIYTRYSSDRQSESSAEDQERLCRIRAQSESWTVNASFSDPAISGSVRNRPGLNAMLARAAEFDVILIEALDRLGRDQEDLAGIYKRLKFAGVRIISLSQGEISEIHVGLNGTMAALFLKELGEKTRRGQIGRAVQGRVPGGICYGYRCVPALKPDGSPDRGLRTIDEAEAIIVRRIFADYLSGIGPREIAHALNREGVPAPRGNVWRANTLIGNRARGTGILHNVLYDGRIVFNRQRFVKDPSTRKRIARLNAEDERVESKVENLRIVEADTFAAVADRFDQLAHVPARSQVRPKRMFSGLIKCGECGGTVTIMTRDRWGCSTAREAGTCSNRVTISNAKLEARILAAFTADLMNADAVAAFVDEYQALQRQARVKMLRDRGKTERRIDAIGAELRRVADAVMKGHDYPEMHLSAQSAVQERARLQADIAATDAEAEIAAHPALAARYRDMVLSLSKGLGSADPDAAKLARQSIREIVQLIEMQPAADGKGASLTLHGDLAGIMSMINASTPRPGKAGGVTAWLVAGVGFEPTTFRL